jgi:signal transduction histidine kinase
VADALALPRPPGVVRRVFRDHPRLSDVLVVAVYLAWAALLSLGRVGGPPVWLVAALALIGAGSLLFRRTRPLLAFAVSAALLLLSGFLGTFSESLLPLLTVYAVGVYRSSRKAWACFGLGAAASVVHGALVGFGIGVTPWVVDDSASPDGVGMDALAAWANNAIPAVVLLLVATLIGTNVGGRVRYVAALLDRAATLERERDQQAEIASAQERERIAREMHDVIAHSLSVMIALSEGAHASVPNRPDEARVAMGRAAETGRRTLTEVRRLLGSVRADREAGGDVAPQPGAGQLLALTEEFARAGLPVRLDLSGTPTSDAALGLTVYRVVQESLTNALRHAAGASTVVAHVRWSADAVEIAVEDDAPRAVEEPDGNDVGRGILGIRERAALYGGTAEAGPRPGNGWRVFVRLPRRGEDA